MAHRDDGKVYIPHHKRADTSPLVIPDNSIAHTIYSNRRTPLTLWQQVQNLSFAFWALYALCIYGLFDIITRW